MLERFLRKIKNREISRLQKIVDRINKLEPKFEKLSNSEILDYSKKLKQKVLDSKDSQSAMVEILEPAFALVREAAKRTLGQRHFDVQLMGGIVLFEGKIAEMITGEGKTLAATLPAYLKALSQKGVHIVTVNDYLAKRDTVWMGQIYNFLGLTVGCLTKDKAYLYDETYSPDEKELDKLRDELGSFKVFASYLRPIERKQAYLADITYGDVHQFGFDYLRDNLAPDLNSQVQRQFNYAIIDEVDSILIDEARTPLIIAVPDTQSPHYYKLFARIAEQLNRGQDYLVDEKDRTVEITDSGIDKVEKILKIDNLFGPKYFFLVHYLQNSLKAKELFLKDRDYLVKDDKVIIIDEFTGKPLPGRRYSGGIHSATEADVWLKINPNVKVNPESRTVAQITIQNFFKLYPQVAGMTGTAASSAEEFDKVYGLKVVCIPTNKPLIRKDLPDRIYKTESAKLKMIVKEIKARHKLGQPILVGTRSVGKNEKLSELLKKENIPHQVLNAKNHEKEGEIIAQAGRLGAVTVATNLAGRGVDIVLGGNPPIPEEAEKVKKLGGLFVLGTERHESRRIDNQLRGRAGRQGDPGTTQFFLSLEDDLLRIFGGERLKALLTTMKLPEDFPIESPLVTKLVNQAQLKVEGMNLDIRRHLLEYDEVLNKQRNFIYKLRQKILEAVERRNLNEALNQIGITLSAGLKLPAEKFGVIFRNILNVLDLLWMIHLEKLEHLRESTALRAYGQREPLVEYRKECYYSFKELQNNLRNLVQQILEHESS